MDSATPSHDENRASASSSPPRSDSSNKLNHKRSLSGGLLAKLPFLRTALEGSLQPLSQRFPDQPNKDAIEDDTSLKHGTTTAGAVRQAKGRKRKGSLRKTAILGTGKLRMEGRERKNSNPDPMNWAAESLHNSAARHTAQSPAVDRPSGMESKPRAFVYDNAAAASSDENWNQVEPPKGRGLAVSTLTEAQDVRLGSPLTSPTSNAYASTTDDDEGLTFSRPSAASHDPYFPLQTPPTTSLLRRRSTLKALPTPLSHVPPSLAPVEEEWDYTDTAWWGYIIIIATWIVFVVGMGSCLGVWSWAWDVGETPYAPPELEDDPTLPIVGYYPALMVLTAVMAWVWVVVAWVGMKYFRHAKVVQS